LNKTNGQMCSTKIEKCLYLRTKRVPAISQNPIPIHRELSFHRPVPIQSYQHQSFFLIHICVKTREFPWPVGPAATPCVTALPPGSPKCAGGWPPHARRARARVLASRLLPSPLPQAAAVPLHCTCPCASGHPPSTPARQSPLTGRRGSSGWGSRSVEAEVPDPQRLFLCLIWIWVGVRGMKQSFWFFVRAWFSGYGAARVVETGLVSLRLCRWRIQMDSLRKLVLWYGCWIGCTVLGLAAVRGEWQMVSWGVF
jgi:hypothetical protein